MKKALVQYMGYLTQAEILEDQVGTVIKSFTGRRTEGEERRRYLVRLIDGPKPGQITSVPDSAIVKFMEG